MLYYLLFLGIFLFSWMFAVRFLMPHLFKRITWTCTTCAEEVQQAARVCPHCGADLRE